MLEVRKNPPCLMCRQARAKQMWLLGAVNYYFCSSSCASSWGLLQATKSVHWCTASGVSTREDGTVVRGHWADKPRFDCKHCRELDKVKKSA